MEVTAQILVLPPFYENLGKRLVKSPKIYLADSGLACHLLGIETAEELTRSPFAGVLFEGFIAAEIAKTQINRGRRPEIYFFRDEQGLEVDLLCPGPGGSLWLVEGKASRTVHPSMAAPIQRLVKALQKKRGPGLALQSCLVYQGSRSGTAGQILVPGVRALPWPSFLAEF